MSLRYHVNPWALGCALLVSGLAVATTIWKQSNQERGQIAVNAIEREIRQARQVYAELAPFTRQARDTAKAEVDAFRAAVLDDDAVQQLRRDFAEDWAVHTRALTSPAADGSAALWELTVEKTNAPITEWPRLFAALAKLQSTPGIQVTDLCVQAGDEGRQRIFSVFRITSRVTIQPHVTL